MKRGYNRRADKTNRPTQGMKKDYPFLTPYMSYQTGLGARQSLHLGIVRRPL